MATVPNPFSITFGDLTVGGATDYQLHGPYVIEKTFETLRLVFDVVVTGTDLATLKALSDDIEQGFRKRLVAGDVLTIDLDGAAWDYTVGETLLAVRSSVVKSGRPEVDRGLSRAYTVTVEGELPADDAADVGLRTVAVVVDFDVARRRTVTMRGTYTATSAGDAVARYKAEFDDEATAYLDAVDNAATWELADENYSMDRERSAATPAAAPASHLCEFTRQYVELIADQSNGLRDDPQIKDHRVVFTDLSQHPGDSRAGVQRLRRVIGSFDCAVDVTTTTDLRNVFESKIRPFVRQEFQGEFSPQVFGVEEERVSFDRTSNRLSVSLQFVYQANNSSGVVEVSQSVAFRENRTIDYTPVHGDDELAAEADVGWATLERVWSRTAIVVGGETPKLRIIESPRAGAAGAFSDIIAGQEGPDAGSRRAVQSDGWNIISSTSQVTPQFVGLPDGQQLELNVLTETVVERFHRKTGTGSRTAVPIQRGPTTGA